MPHARHAHIAGLGLIGGSIGIALRRAGWRVSFEDPNVALDEALAAGAADDGEGGGADVVIIATPVDGRAGECGRGLAPAGGAAGPGGPTRRAWGRPCGGWRGGRPPGGGGGRSAAAPHWERAPSTGVAM